MMCRGQFQVAGGDSVPKMLRFGTSRKTVTDSSPNLGCSKAFLHTAKCGKGMRTRASRLLT